MYRQPITDPAKLQALRRRCSRFFGSQDGGIPVDSVKAMAAVLDSLGKNEVVEFFDAGHGSRIRQAGITTPPPPRQRGSGRRSSRTTSSSDVRRRVAAYGLDSATDRRIASGMRYVINRFREPGGAAPPADAHVRDFHRTLPGYEPTPLHRRRAWPSRWASPTCT